MTFGQLNGISENATISFVQAPPQRQTSDGWTLAQPEPGLLVWRTRPDAATPPDPTQYPGVRTAADSPQADDRDVTLGPLLPRRALKQNATHVVTRELKIRTLAADDGDHGPGAQVDAVAVA